MALPSASDGSLFIALESNVMYGKIGVNKAKIPSDGS